MCTEKEVKLNQTQLNKILDTCTTVLTLANNQKLMEQKNVFLEKQIDAEVIERKEEIRNIEKENRERFNKIEGKFEVLFNSIGKIHKRIDSSMEKMNKHIRNGM